MTPSEKQALRALCEKATPGPWKHVQQLTATGEVHVDIIRAPGDATLSFDGDGGDGDFYEHDAAFIAAARTALPELLDECEELNGLLAEAKCERDGWEQNHSEQVHLVLSTAAERDALRSENESLKAALAGNEGELAGLRVSAGVFQQRAESLEKILIGEPLSESEQDALKGCCPLRHPPHVVCKGCGLTLEEYQAESARLASLRQKADSK